MMWVAAALLVFLVTLVFLLVRLSKAKATAEARYEAKWEAEQARRKRDEIEENVFGLDDADLECLREKWTRR